MSESLLAGDAEAPYGRKKDGTPAKKRGRPSLSLTPEGEALFREPDFTFEEDTPPAWERPKPAKLPNVNAKGETIIPPYKAGLLVPPLTKLYQQTGKLIKTFDKPVGLCVIEQAHDCAVAWDDLAKTNPAVRAFLLRLIAPGQWGAILMAHLPILLAIVMRDAFMKKQAKDAQGRKLVDQQGRPVMVDRFNLFKLAGAFADDADTGATGPLGNLSQEDMAQMAQLFTQFNFEPPGGQT